ncbi:hypothetical protein C8R43DRAFT_1205239 [Mycena crocata]|nr:hypothetical protein C8R43DRAFT_1205239 [Mycena crocata]
MNGILSSTTLVRGATAGLGIRFHYEVYKYAGLHSVVHLRRNVGFYLWHSHREGSTPASVDAVIYLDYLLYTTTTAPVNGSSESYFIDDRNARITYSPATAWTEVDGTGVDFQHTSKRSTGVGDSLSLNFEGKSISFYGGITSQIMNASMAIDGGPPVFFVPPAGAQTTNNLIFNSGDLADGNHTLVVTAQTDQPVWADYFLVTLGVSAPAPSPTQTARRTPIAAIIGSVVGALIIVIAAVLAFFFFRRRRRRQERRSLSVDRSTEPRHPPDWLHIFLSGHATDSTSGAETTARQVGARDDAGAGIVRIYIASSPARPVHCILTARMRLLPEIQTYSIP